MKINRIMLSLFSFILILLGVEIFSGGLIATPQGRIPIQIGFYKYPVGTFLILIGMYFLYLLLKKVK